MNNLRFKLAPHKINPNITVCEVWDEHTVVAIIYPSGEYTFRVTSAHINAVAFTDGRQSEPPIPVFEITLLPERYVVVGGQIIRGTAAEMVHQMIEANEAKHDPKGKLNG